MARDCSSVRPVGAVVAIFTLGYLVLWIVVGIIGGVCLTVMFLLKGMIG